MHFLASARIKATIGLGRRPDRTWAAWVVSTKEAAWVASAGQVRYPLVYSKGGWEG